MVVSVGIGAIGGYQIKSSVYEIRNDSGVWERDNTSCLAGTLERDPFFLEPEGPPLDYRYVGECRTPEAVLGGALAGLLPPFLLLVLVMIGRWIVLGFRPSKIGAPGEEGSKK